jgi:hypothetical protein
LIVFFACTYALSWAVWAPLVVLGDEVPAAPALLLAMLGSWVPSTVGIALTARLRGRQGVRELLRRVVRLRVGARWYVAAFSLPLLMPLTVCINVLFGGDVPTAGVVLVLSVHRPAKPTLDPRPSSDSKATTVTGKASPPWGRGGQGIA